MTYLLSNYNRWISSHEIWQDRGLENLKKSSQPAQSLTQPLLIQSNSSELVSNVQVYELKSIYLKKDLDL